VTPIERAVPAMVLTLRVEVGAGQVLGLDLGDLFELGARDLADLVGIRRDEPLSSLMARLISTVAGGDFSTNVNDLSAKAVMTTGSLRPGSMEDVWALNALQNSMMFRPR